MVGSARGRARGAPRRLAVLRHERERPGGRGRERRRERRPLGRPLEVRRVERPRLPSASPTHPRRPPDKSPAGDVPGDGDDAPAPALAALPRRPRSFPGGFPRPPRASLERLLGGGGGGGDGRLERRLRARSPRVEVAERRVRLLDARSRLLLLPFRPRARLRGCHADFVPHRLRARERVRGAFAIRVGVGARLRDASARARRRVARGGGGVARERRRLVPDRRRRLPDRRPERRRVVRAEARRVRDRRPEADVDPRDGVDRRADVGGEPARARRAPPRRPSRVFAPPTQPPTLSRARRRLPFSSFRRPPRPRPRSAPLRRRRRTRPARRRRRRRRRTRRARRRRRRGLRRLPRAPSRRASPP